MAQHMMRLAGSLEGIDLPIEWSLDQLANWCDELVAANGLNQPGQRASVYLQITRGPAKRNHIMPSDPQPTLMIMADPVNDKPRTGLRVMTTPDVRWEHCWIKSLMLLPNSLARTRAIQQGCDDALFVRDQIITEATSANVMAMIDGTLRYHPTNGRILPGVTMQAVMQIAESLAIPMQAKPIGLDELPKTSDLFLTGTTSLVAGIVRVDDYTISDGQVGPITQQLSEALDQMISRSSEA